MMHHHLLEMIGRLSLPELLALRSHLDQQIRSRAIEAGPDAFTKALRDSKDGRNGKPPGILPESANHGS